MDENEREFRADAASFAALTAEIVSAYVANNPVPIAELPTLLASIHGVIAGLGRGAVSAEPTAEKPTPAQIRKSITPDALISFEDGKPYKTLRRHLTIRGLSPEAYREKWGLPRDYPMTAVSYSAARSALAKSLGLGRPVRQLASFELETVAEKSKRASRPRKAMEPVGT